MSISIGTTPENQPDAYQIKIGGVIADPYRIALAYELDPVIAQAVKKLLRCGRKHKSKAVDVQEAITTLQRWQQIQAEDQQHQDNQEEVTRLIPGPLTRRWMRDHLGEEEGTKSPY